MIDGVAAANWLAGYGPVPVGYCLKYVWLAYKAQGASTGMSAGTAYQAWGLSDGKRPGDRNPPPGAAVWWGRRYDGNLDGDVTISLGGGRIAATDWPTGRTGITTIDAREAQIGRVYLGWTSSIFDCPINVAAGKDAAPTPAPSIPSEEDDMFVKLYKMGTGIVAVGSGGGFWIVPSQSYVDLLQAWGIAGPVVEREIDQNELDTMCRVLRTVNPATDSAQVKAVLDAVAALGKALPR